MTDGTDTPDTRRRQALELHESHLRLLLEKDMDGWVDQFADDATFELPFAPRNYPDRLEGKEAIRDYIKDYPKHIDLHSFPEVTVHQTLDPDVMVVEMRVEGRVVATDEPYRMRYVSIVTTSGGKITRYRDYWNPLTLLETMGGEQAVLDAFAAGRADP